LPEYDECCEIFSGSRFCPAASAGNLIDIDDAAPNGVTPKSSQLSSEGRGLTGGALSVINLAHYFVAKGRKGASGVPQTENLIYLN